VVVGKASRLIGHEAIQMHGGIGMTAEYAVGHLAARLATIERTWGDTRQHLAALAGSVASHETVEVI
jgi:alkylation response protein AidB-like acyl-CoA dehydrogenase